MPALTKLDRDALPADAFAVPDRRLLPIHDEAHVSMAWREVERVRGIADDQRAAARRTILARAETLGVDTAVLTRIKGMSLQAMSLNIPDCDGHPNRHPFSGILVRLDEPSDVAPHGSNGRRVTLTRVAAEAAIDTLVGMGVDFTPDLDGHDARAKIGLITGAHVVDEAEGPAVAIEGFFYAADFPDETARIHAASSDLGFSFEAKNIFVADPLADVLEITELAFTGAAVLFKDKAAYWNTSLAASAAQGIIDMTKEEMAALLGESLTTALAPLTARLDAVEAGAAKTNDAVLKALEASRSVMDMVEPHAAALEAAATAMETAGVGVAAASGYVATLTRMAGQMRADAALGRVPSSVSYSCYAGAEKAPEATPAPVPAAVPAIDAAAIAKAVADAVAPLNAKIEAAEARATKAEDAVAATETKVADLKAAGVREAAEPGRKTVAPLVAGLMAKAGIVAPEGDAKLDIGAVNKALDAAGLNSAQRMQVKAGMGQAGLID